MDIRHLASQTKHIYFSIKTIFLMKYEINILSTVILFYFILFILDTDHHHHHKYYFFITCFDK